jgi:hypothetical protein
MTSIVILAMLCHLVVTVSSVHFQGGTITWRLLDTSATGSPVAVVITKTYIWTPGQVLCTYAMVASNQSVIYSSSHSRLNSVYLNCISNCTNGSFSYVAPLIRPYCTSISPSIRTITRQRSDIINITAGVGFTVAFQEYAWRRLKNITSVSWSLSMGINLAPRSDNGLFNNAPIVMAIPSVSIPVNQSTPINIEARDPDGGAIRCRWSTNLASVDECGQTCAPSSLPQNTTIDPNCAIMITGESIDGWHALTIMVRSSAFMNKTDVIYSDIGRRFYDFVEQHFTKLGSICRIHPENTLSTTFSTIPPIAQTASSHHRMSIASM